MADWQSISAKKQAERYAKIPEAWRLPESTVKQCTPEAHLNVLAIPRSCGILSEKEIELTENYDAFALLKLLAAGNVRQVASRRR